jgi:hypothetical protein
MAFTRDWLSSWILDHSKFKTQPSYARGLMDDIGERLAAYLYGFTTTETFTGFKQLRLITIGTGSGNTPTGTGVQAAINVEGRTINSKVELITIDADGNEIQLTSRGGNLPNNTWFKGNLVNTGGNLNILRVNTANQIEMGTGFGTHLVGPDTGPTAALQYAPKGYVDYAIDTAIDAIADDTTIVINTGTNVISVGNALGAWVDKSASYGAQQAATDGYVLVILYNMSDSGGYIRSLKGFTDANANPTTLRQGCTAEYFQNTDSVRSFTMPVKKSNYWKVTDAISGAGSSTLAVYWISLGS